MFLLFIIFAFPLTYSLVGLVNNAGLISIAEHNLHFNHQNRSDHWKFFDLVIISSEYSKNLFQIRIQAFFSPVNSFLMDDIGRFQVCSRLLGLYRSLHHDYEFMILLHPATPHGDDQAVMPTPRGRRLPPSHQGGGAFIEYDRREFIYYFSAGSGRLRLAGNPWICNNICNS